jgi:thymidylate kinase
MIILINGSFGVGKTTVAKRLVERIPKSTLFNPEIIGFALQRLPEFVPLSGRGTEDFQDIALWRRLTALTALTINKTAKRTIIVPMAFCKLKYLNQIRSELLGGKAAVHHFCLTAPVEVIYERLEKRGVDPASIDGRWIYARVAGCCEIHSAAEFGKHIETNERTPDEIADEILKTIRSV